MTLEPSPSSVLPALERLRRVDLNLLLSLHALLYFRSVTAAGKHLGVTQPTMSGDLRRLREMLGDQLLVGTRGHYQLTALGTSLVAPVAEVVAAIDQALLTRPTFDPAVDTREFSISMADYALLLLVRPLVEMLAREAPRVTVHFQGPSQRMLKLARGDVDLVISPTNDPSVPNFPDGRSEALYSHGWVCVVDAANPHVGQDLTAEVFRSLPHLEIAIGTPPVVNPGEQAYRAAGLTARVPVTTESFALTPVLVLGTELVAIVPERVARHLAATAPLRVLQLPCATPRTVQAMYWNALTDADPAHVWLRSMLRRIAGGFPAASSADS
jgi:DNA-binding transcriptional LysR family regulator